MSPFAYSRSAMTADLLLLSPTPSSLTDQGMGGGIQPARAGAKDESYNWQAHTPSSTSRTFTDPQFHRYRVGRILRHGFRSVEVDSSRCNKPVPPGCLSPIVEWANCPPDVSLQTQSIINVRALCYVYYTARLRQGGTVPVPGGSHTHPIVGQSSFIFVRFQAALFRQEFSSSTINMFGSHREF